MLQNYARKNKIAIDSLQFSIEVRKDPVDKVPESGCFIDGMFIEGARWDFNTNSLEEPFDKVLYTKMPIIWLNPVENPSETQKKAKIYNCPVYRTANRAGTLSTTGHSTNYVMGLPLLTNYEEKHWIQRGVAMITQVND